MNTPSQILIRNPEIEWSELLSVSFRPFRVSSHLPCLCEWVRLIVKTMQIKNGRKGKKEKKTHTQLPGFELALLCQLFSFACWKLNLAAKETKYDIHCISEVMSRSRKPPSEKVTLLTQFVEGKRDLPKYLFFDGRLSWCSIGAAIHPD